MQPHPDAERSEPVPFSSDELRALQRRSDARGLLRFGGHLGVIAVTGSAYGLSFERIGLPLAVVFAVPYGFALVTMFAAMHESVHRTAFKTRWVNDAVAWFAGLLAFYNSTFYRYYHGWHHRFTQLPGKDPELEDEKPRNIRGYVVEMSGFSWWVGKLKTHVVIAGGNTRDYGFLNDTTRPEVVRSVRMQLLVYAAGVGGSLALGSPAFFLYWLLPVALGQPLLRAILLAEHGGCSQDSNPLANTRTTHTVFPVRFLMWEMPYHAEHHHYPALPFFALARTHARLGPHLLHVARRGYLRFHAEFLRGLVARRTTGGVAE